MPSKRYVEVGYYNIPERVGWDGWISFNVGIVFVELLKGGKVRADVYRNAGSKKEDGVCHPKGLRRDDSPDAVSKLLFDEITYLRKRSANRDIHPPNSEG